jgi:hypothetical protein
VEEIDTSGASLQGPERWTLAFPRPAIFSWDGVKDIFLGHTGHFRLFVFVVTDQQWSSGPALTIEQQADFINGPDTLAEEIAIAPVTTRHRCTVLIYEYQKNTPDDELHRVSSGLTAEQHLLRSNIFFDGAR